MATERDQTITVNGRQYRLDDLSDEAKAQLSSLRACDAEIRRLKSLIAIAETARNAYARALDAQLPKPTN